MNIPKGLIKKDKKKLKQLMEGPKILTGQAMLRESCMTFLEKQTILRDYSEMYNLAEEIAEKTVYTKDDLEDLSQEIAAPSKHNWYKEDLNEEERIEKGILYENEHSYLGLYLSALVNKIIKEDDVIRLAMNDLKLEGLGAYLKKGFLRIEGSTRFYTGFKMQGGTLIVEESTGNYTGFKMQGGTLIVRKTAGFRTGIHMGEEK